MRETTVRELFARRQFTQVERDNMKDLYSNAELLALRIVKTIPEGVEQELAIRKLKEVLGECETAVALNPRPTFGDACDQTGPSQMQARNEKSLHTTIDRRS